MPECRAGRALGAHWPMLGMLGCPTEEMTHLALSVIWSYVLLRTLAAKKSKIRQMQHDVITPHSRTICDFGPDTVCVRARVASYYAWCGAQALGPLIYAPY